MEEPGLTITRFYRYGEEVDDITQDLYDHMDYSRSLGFAYTQRLIDDPHYLHQKLQDALEYVCGDYASFFIAYHRRVHAWHRYYPYLYG